MSTSYRLGRQRQVWLILIVDERVGVQVKLWDALRTRAIPEHFWGGVSRRAAISSVRTFTFSTAAKWLMLELTATEFHSVQPWRQPINALCQVHPMEAAPGIINMFNEKALREMQTLRAGCSKVEPKIFAPPDPFLEVQDGQNLISWRWSLPSPTDPVWWRSMHAILSYRGNRPTHTHKHTHPQTHASCPLQTHRQDR